MSVVTKIAHVETTTAIWEFDPTLPRNQVLGSSLDVIAAIRTLAIKIQASGQRIAYFERLQKECGVAIPLKIPLHSNVHWGTADGMLAQSYDLRRVSSSYSISYCASLIFSIGDQPVYQLSGSALWPYHLNPPHRLSDQTYPVVSIHLEVGRLGTHSRHSSHHL